MPTTTRRVKGILSMLSAGAVAAGAWALLTPAATAGASGASFVKTDRYHSVIAVTKYGTKLADSQSSNWSGYNEGILDTKTPFSSISGTWVVPKATQHTARQAESSATWIGIGGGCLNSACDATDTTLIQAGTEQDVSAAGVASYYSWWEIIPGPETASSIKVRPGDTISCSISSTTPGLWTITLKDATDGQHFTVSTPYPSDESTAEWIEETPTVISTSGAGLAALPNLTTVHFTKASVNGKSANLKPAQGIQLVDSSGKVIMDPSLPYLGTAFNDCAWATTCPKP
jgi:hypothetical protein